MEDFVSCQDRPGSSSLCCGPSFIWYPEPRASAFGLLCCFLYVPMGQERAVKMEIPSFPGLYQELGLQASHFSTGIPIIYSYAVEGITPFLAVSLHPVHIL